MEIDCAPARIAAEVQGPHAKKKRNLRGIRTQESRMEESMTRYLFDGNSSGAFF